MRDCNSPTASASQVQDQSILCHRHHTQVSRVQHHRNLLYTGVTRAQETAIIIGDHWAIHHCAKKREVDRRNTFLSFLLMRAPCTAELTSARTAVW